MTENKKIRVVIVDDSAFMRIALERMLKEDPSIEVVGSAANGVEAVSRAIKLKPDVITLDVEMPIMDGLQALKEIMHICPIPVIMVSSLTHEGAKVREIRKRFCSRDWQICPIAAGLNTAILLCDGSTPGNVTVTPFGMAAAKLISRDTVERLDRWYVTGNVEVVE